MRRTLALIPVVAALVAASCGGGNDATGPGGRPAVVAAFFPLAEAAERIGGDRVDVTNITPAGAEPHDLELTTGVLDRVLDADLVVYVGGFQPALDEAVADARGTVLDVLEDLTLLGASAGEDGGTDPHVWLDPKLWKRAVTRVADALSQVDPAGAEGYRARAAAYARTLDAIDEAFTEGLSSCRHDVLVTAHAAFGHLAARYGLRQEAISGISPEAEPDPRRLAELADLVRGEGVTTVFTEELVSPDVARALARETGVRTAVLDPMESRPAGGYTGGMRSNLRLLRTALDCR